MLVGQQSYRAFVSINDGDRMRLFRRADNEMVFDYESASLYLNSAYNGIYFEGDSSAVKMRLTGDGDLGIGTTSPGARLHILGGTSYNNTEGIRLGTTSTYASIYTHNANAGLEIDSPHTLILDANRHMEFHAGGTTREHRYMYATTQYGFMTTADSNTYWAIGNKSPASNGLLLSGAAGGIRMVQQTQL